MIATLLLALIGSIALSLLVILREWRGVVISQSLNCGRCQFILEGLPTPVRTCPECGCDFQRSPRKLRYEQRYRRWWLLGPAIAMPIVLVLMLGGSLVSRGGRQVLLRHAPASFARAQVTLGGTFCDEALTELQSRIMSGTLAPAERDELITYLLQRQADQTREWRVKMGDVIMAARMANAVSDADWAAFAAGSVTVSAKCRPTAVSGREIPISVTLGKGRGGAVGLPPMVRVSVDWAPPDQADRARAKPLGGAMATVTPTFTTRGPRAVVASGEQAVPVTVFLDVPPMNGSGFASSGTPAATHSFTLKTMVSPPTVPIVTRRKDAVAAEALKRALKVREATLVLSSGEDAPQCRVELRADARPANFAYDVFIRFGPPARGEETKLGTITGTTNSGFSSWILSQPVTDIGTDTRRPASVDVILRPSEEAAVESIDLDWYLDEVIEIVGHKVGQEKPTQ